MAVPFRIKQMLFWLAYRFDQLLPKRLCVAARNRCLPWRRPVLDVVELHLTDHCNLNCTGCLHFTPLARPWFADPERMACDLTALRAKFRYIRHVTLLGGEPLLHPDLCKAVAAVRHAAPESLVTVVTNGVALKGAVLESFLNMCRENAVRVKWTVYPPLAGRRDELAQAFRSVGVNMFAVEMGDFYVKMDPKGGDARKAMRFCRNTTYCPYLRDGRLYTCAQAYHIRDYIAACERERGTAGQMRAAVGLDVHDAALGGWEILDYLMTPCETCRFCSDGVRYIPWTQGVKSVKEWERR